MTGGMIDAWEIGVSLVLDDQITGQVGDLSTRFDAVQAAVDKINASLKLIPGNLSDVRAAAAGLSASFTAAANAAERMRAAVAAGGGAGGAYVPVPGAPGEVAQPAPAGGAGAPAAPPLAIPAAPQVTGEVGGNVPGAAGLPGQPGVSVPALIPGASTTEQGPQRWASVPITGYGDAQPYGAGGGGREPPNWTPGGAPPPDDEPFERPGEQQSRQAQDRGASPMHMMSTIFVAQAGADIARSAVKGAVTPSFDIQTQLTQIGNMTPAGADKGAVEKQALDAAYAIEQKYPGISLGDALEMETNFYSVDRDMTRTAKLSDQYARANYAMANISKKPEFQDKLYNALRAGEDAGYFTNPQTGQVDPTKEMAFLDDATSIAVSSGGKIMPDNLLTLVGTAGPEFSQMSHQAVMRAIVQTQALGASQVGTGINALAQEFLGGKMSQATARALHEAGQLPDYMFGPDGNIKTEYLVGSDGKKIAYSKDGKGKILNDYKYGIGQVMLPPGSLKDEGDALRDPIGWAETHLFGQYMDANGVLKPGEANQEAFEAAVNRSFSRLPGGKLVGNAIINDAVQTRAITNAANIPSTAQIAKADANTANAQAAGVGTAWNAFLAAAGSPLLPAATEGFKILTAGLNELAQGTRHHPVATAAADVAVAGTAAFIGIKALQWVKGEIASGLRAAFSAAGAGAMPKVGPVPESAVKAAAAGGEAEVVEAALAGGPVVIGGIIAAAITKALIDDRNRWLADHPDYVNRGGGKFAMGGPTGHKSDPIYVAPATSGPPGGPTMPTGPTTAQTSASMPHPGKTLAR